MTAAAGIQRVINTRMAEGIRLVSVRRGVDPRRFALLAFGGAAGLHVTDLARQLGLRRVVVPRLAAVLSAWGMLTSDLRYEIARSHIGDASRLDAEALRAIYAAMEAEGRERLAAASFAGEVRVQRSADMRYGEQIFEVSVGLDGIDWSAPEPARAAGPRLPPPPRGALHLCAAGSGSGPGQRARRGDRRAAVAAAGAEPRRPAAGSAARPAPDLPRGDGTRCRCSISTRSRRGSRSRARRWSNSATTTVLLRPGDHARTSAIGWLDITVGES